MFSYRLQHGNFYVNRIQYDPFYVNRIQHDQFYVSRIQRDHFMSTESHTSVFYVQLVKKRKKYDD